MIDSATLWGLFGASCGLLVTIAVLSRVLVRGKVATAFVLVLGLVGLAFIGGLLLLGPGPHVDARRTGGTRYSQVAEGTSGTTKTETTIVLGDGSILQTPGDVAIQHTQSRGFDPQRLKHQVEGFVERSHKRLTHRRIVGSLVLALAIAAFLYVAYLLLDASTRGHFSWSLRVVSVILFGVIYLAVAVLR